jgi:hypothetical protein
MIIHIEKCNSLRVAAKRKLSHGEYTAQLSPIAGNGDFLFIAEIRHDRIIYRVRSHLFRDEPSGKSERSTSLVGPPSRPGR